MNSVLLINGIVGGIVFGAVYALIGASLNVLCGVLRIINFAHGEFILAGSFLAYVLLNARRHFAKARGGRKPPVRLDRASSGRWFDGWKRAWGARLNAEAPEHAGREVATARTWLLRTGWRRHGLVEICCPASRE